MCTYLHVYNILCFPKSTIIILVPIIELTAYFCNEAKACQTTMTTRFVSGTQKMSSNFVHLRAQKLVFTYCMRQPRHVYS